MRFRKPKRPRKAKRRKASATGEGQAADKPRNLAPRRVTSWQGGNQSGGHDSNDEREFSRKIAEARVLLHLHSNSASNATPSPSMSSVARSPSPTDANICPSPEYHAPVMAVPSSSLSVSNRELEYAVGIGIAMTEHERGLLEALLPRHTLSEGPEYETLGDLALSPEPEGDGLFAEDPAGAAEGSCSFVGYAINFHTDDVDDD